MKHEQKMYKELKFTDDFMFGKVLTNSPEVCRRLLELLLGIRIKKVLVPEKQKVVEILSDGKGIRLDVYVDDEEGTVYDIEMQTSLKKDLPKRSRYYQGMIDMNLIERGAKYKELKRSFVIFICLEDPFGRALPVYRFENICIQDRSLELKDEAVKVFINADGDLAEANEDMATFLRYLKGSGCDSELVRMIDGEVERARLHKEWEVEYMTLYLRDQENREEGREEGREESETRLILNMHNRGYALEEIAKIAEKGIEEVEAIIEKAGSALA